VPADSCSPTRHYACITSNREHTLVGLAEELCIHKRGEDGVPCLGIEAKQAAGLGHRELESGHLEVFGTDSAQQFRKSYLHA